LKSYKFFEKQNFSQTGINLAYCLNPKKERQRFLETRQCWVILEKWPVWIRAGRGKMTVFELISRLTPEERNLLMDLILEYLNREWFLMEIKRAIKTSEEELKQSFDLLSRLNNLAQAAKENADQIQIIYLRLTKGKGNA
jgi:ABC-type molybdenum transport system ATPase subunit/photorepair protein PhrA